MGKSITIRDVPDAPHAELAARAALTGRSLQEYLRLRLVELAEKPDPDALMARVRKRKRQTNQALSRDAILAHRDADRTQTRPGSPVLRTPFPGLRCSVIRQ